MFFHLFISNRNKNENTYNTFNKLRFPISFGIFPDILFLCKSLNNCKTIKIINMIFFAKYMIGVFPFVYFKQKYECKYLQVFQ